MDRSSAVAHPQQKQYCSTPTVIKVVLGPTYCHRVFLKRSSKRLMLCSLLHGHIKVSSCDCQYENNELMGWSNEVLPLYKTEVKSTLKLKITMLRYYLLTTSILLYIRDNFRVNLAGWVYFENIN